MRPNQPSTPTLSLYTSFQPHPGNNNNDNNNTDNHPYNTSNYYSATSAPNSPLSSTSTITSSNRTLPSSPTSPSLSPTLFQHPSPISDKLNPSHNHTQSTGLILRRRLSNIDTLLRQERSRATRDVIERQGLDLLEPRPVELDPIGMDTRLQVHATQTRLPIRRSTGSGDGRGQNWLSSGSAQLEGLGDGFQLSQPRFVMGGIFEVMEGRG
ncbi:hypothetical protein BJX76DRAFT_322387 [Aspergillus varians]